MMRPIYLVGLVGLTALGLLGCHKPCDGATLCDNENIDGSSSGDAASHHDGATSHDDGGASSRCPTVTLSPTLPLSYSGNTAGKADLVKSMRLEWGNAPDDALLFVAPQAGTYTMAMPSEPSANGGCGASAQDYNSMTNFTEGSCPAQGQVADLDGIFNASGGHPGEITVTQGQHVLIWVSCTTWSTAQAGPYTLTLTKK